MPKTLNDQQTLTAIGHTSNILVKIVLKHKINIISIPAFHCISSDEKKNKQTTFASL